MMCLPSWWRLVPSEPSPPPLTQQNRQPALLNRIARVLLCLVFAKAVMGKLTGFARTT
jgi:hypothetical protein